jgi:predicted 3-demethylubiquinone-9 3-methyltransferase (glyoxalase superfamily)
MTMPKITPFLWFDSPLEEVVRYYRSIFENSRVHSLSPQMASFEIEGQRFHALNGGPHHDFNDAVSFFIDCEDQDEVDRYWSRLTADGGAESMCGWCRDKYGVSWQVIPKALVRYLTDPDRDKAGRVTQAMLQMRKIDVSSLDRAAAAA